MSVNSAVAWPNGKAYLFSDSTYTRYDFVSGSQDQPATAISGNWPGLPTTAPDAIAYWGFGKAYFFYGDHYVQYNIPAPEGVDADYLPPNPPTPIAGNWTGLWSDRIDSAVNWGTGKIYFFRDAEYIRYDITFERVDPGYPKSIASNWPGLWPSGIDAALYQGGNFAYFFKNDDFIRYDLKANTYTSPAPISSMTLDPVPGGMWTPARDMTLAQANLVMGYLIESGYLTLKAAWSPYVGSWKTVITSPSPTARVAVEPNVVNGITFENDSTPRLHSSKTWINE